MKVLHVPLLRQAGRQAGRLLNTHVSPLMHAVMCEINRLNYAPLMHIRPKSKNTFIISETINPHGHILYGLLPNIAQSASIN